MIGRLFRAFLAVLHEPLVPALIGSAAVHLGALALLVTMERTNQLTISAGGVVTVEVVLSDGPGAAAAAANEETFPAVLAGMPRHTAQPEQAPEDTLAPLPPEQVQQSDPGRATAPTLHAAEALRPESASAVLVPEPPPPPRPRPDFAEAAPTPDSDPARSQSADAPTPDRSDEAMTATVPNGATQRAALAGTPSRGAAPLAGNPSPAYPFQARLRGIEGLVLLRVEVDPDGRAAAVSVAETSGDASLDAAAEAAVRRWRFSPALRGGAHTADQLLVPVRFQLH